MPAPLSPGGNTFERAAAAVPYGSQIGLHQTIMRPLRGLTVWKEEFVVRNYRPAPSISAWASVVAVGVALSFNPAIAASDNPFVELAGTWSGSGTARFDNGKTESLRCKGYYTNNGGPTNLGLSIRCANASAKVELRANLTNAHGTVSGDWEERTYNQSGTVAGKASSNKMNLSISGGISGSMSVAISGGSHSVTVATSGPSFKGVNISMSR